MRFIALCILLFLASVTGSAFAAQAVDPSAADPSLVDLARPVMDALVHGHPFAAGALAIVLACALARKYMPAKYKDGIKGDVLGTALAFGMAFFGAVGAALAMPGAHVSMVLFGPAFHVGIIAVGGYTVLHKLASWIAETKWYQQHAPGWLKAAMKLGTSIFGSDALKKAEAAGEAAVVADPPKGMAGGEAVVEVQ